jgi:large conductance mechanosensitive channel
LAAVLRSAAASAPVAAHRRGKEAIVLKEFREFISRGNVMDLAVAVVIGAAFTAIVNSLVADIIMPIVGVLVGGIDFGTLSLSVGKAAITYGKFIQAIVNFLIVAWVVFLAVKSVNEMERRLVGPPPEPAPPGPTTEELLTEIRDLLKSGR